MSLQAVVSACYSFDDVSLVELGRFERLMISASQQMPDTSFSYEVLSARIASIRQRIEASAKRGNRAVEQITLIAVTKTHPSHVLQQAIDAGMRDFGENRVQEAEPKIGELGRENKRWHLIGNLQANKARRAVNLFDIIHTLDSVSLAHRLDRLCAEENRDLLPVLIQVNVADEVTKAGVSESELPKLVEEVVASKHLRLSGLMTIPPFLDDAEQVRPFFRRLREWRDQLATQRVFDPERGELSMGMSHDYEVAIEEGATMVRIGTALFGSRPVTT